MQIRPSKELAPYIKHYLFLESVGMMIKKLRLFSDGNPGMLFSLKNKLTLNHGPGNTLIDLPSAFLYGQITEFKDIFLPSGTSMIIVVFQPAGLNKLLGVPAGQLRDQIVNIEEFFGKKGLEIEDQLSGKAGIEDRVRLLDLFFTGIVYKTTGESDFLVPPTLNFILKNKGIVTMSQLVKYTGYTERHIERRFLESIGITPKKFINIIKLHGFLKNLNASPINTNFTGLAYEAGYSDQSHLIKEFKKYTGMTPKLYRNDTGKMTVNFVEYPFSSHPPGERMSGLYNFPVAH